MSFTKSQLNLGVMYFEGQGVTQNYEIASKWLKLAAELGAVHAQTNLSIMYLQGRGVNQDYTRAYMWLNIAASKGDEDAKKILRRVEQIMTPDQIAAAQEITRNCVEKNYKDC